MNADTIPASSNHFLLSSVLKPMVTGAYMLQQQRVAIGNKLFAAFRTKLGLSPNEKAEDKEDADTGLPVDTENGEGSEDVVPGAAAILAQLRTDFAKITDGVKKELPSKRSFKGTPLIGSYAELCLLANYLATEKVEKDAFKRLGDVLSDFPIYTEFLSNIAGCGPAMSAVILSGFDIYKAKYPSSLWQYIGAGVEKDGQGTSKRKEHLVEIAYLDAKKQPQTRMGIRHNNWLKTKLLGVLPGAIFKACVRWEPVIQEVYDTTPDEVKAMKLKKDPHGKMKLTPCVRLVSGEYAPLYYQYRNRLDHRAAPGPDNNFTVDWTKASPMRKHRAAIRFMIKVLLLDLYKVWRAMEGLEVHPPYSEAKLGMAPHGRDPSVEERHG
jgi:hypothetical protein